ncbi:MAG TPA: hypothetical protein VFE33_18980 [Thermoanaerobaculia bacterium]|nr:hypothetical protein [Thermoanaerobaculia bacterium]
MNRWIAIVTLCLLASPGQIRADELRVPRKAASEIEKDLSSATKVELLSLYSGESDGPLSEEESKVRFHGYPVLGALDITNRPERAAIVHELAKDIGRSPLKLMACFYPRHGIRARLPGGKTLGLVICFECSSVDRYKGGKILQLNIDDDKPQDLLNSILRKAGIRIGSSPRRPGT